MHKIISSALMLGSIVCSTQVFAQEDTSVSANKLQSSSKINVVKLQATIRGNKEQPNVLSIVPWQLPLYSRIDGEVPQIFAPPVLSQLYRNSFVKEQALYEKLFNSSSVPQ